MGSQTRSKETEAEIVALYKKGKSQKEIADMYNTYNTSIRRILLRHKVQLRNSSRVLRYCKHNPFKRNDEYSDYFLGLLLTDGCISTNSSKPNSNAINLSLSEKDGYMVEVFRDWASPKSKVSKILQPINNSYMYSVNITNEEMETWLRRKGNFIRKSYECKIYIPLNWNILRGIFDGDGGFHIDRERLSFFICSKSLAFIHQIESFLNKYGFTVYVRERKNGNKVSLYYVEIYKIHDILKLGELLYQNAHIFLKRKYERWLAFYESRRAYGVNSGKEMAIQP